MSRKIEACPFCGSKRVETKKIWGDRRFVACSRCKAGGPVGLTPEDALIRWNKRANPDPDEPKQAELF